MDDRLRCRKTHWLPGFNVNVEEWFEGDRYEMRAICRTLAPARVAFKVAVEEKPSACS
jgi:hypothetical protein